MIRMTSMYPATEGGYFDHEYYATVHLKMNLDLCGPFGLKRVQVWKGVSTPEFELLKQGQPPTAPAKFVCVGHYDFETIEGYVQAVAAHGEELGADIPEYTNITPIFQVGELVADESQ